MPRDCWPVIQGFFLFLVWSMLEIVISFTNFPSQLEIPCPASEIVDLDARGCEEELPPFSDIAGFIDHGEDDVGLEISFFPLELFRSSFPFGSRTLFFARFFDQFYPLSFLFLGRTRPSRKVPGCTLSSPHNQPPPLSLFWLPVVSPFPMVILS